MRVLCWMYGFLLCAMIQQTSRSVRGQQLECPAEDWVLGSSVSLRCMLSKTIYPGKCMGLAFLDQVVFFKDDVSINKCTLRNVSTCTPSSAACDCVPGNSTYIVLQLTFTVTAGDKGTWGCSTYCPDSKIQNQLPYAAYNCDNRDVVDAPSVACSMSNNNDTGNVTVSCTISNAYSARNKYICDLREEGSFGLSLGTSRYSSGSGSGHVSGNCSFSFAAPTSSGAYSYTVIVYPGAIAFHAGSVTISDSGSVSVSQDEPGVTVVVPDSVSIGPPRVESTTISTKTTMNTMLIGTTTDAASSGSLALTSALLMTVTLVVFHIL